MVIRLVLKVPKIQPAIFWEEATDALVCSLKVRSSDSNTPRSFKLLVRNMMFVSVHYSV